VRIVNQPPRRPFLIALIVSCGFFMNQLDSTVIATALPQMARSFHETPVNVSIGITAYVLTLAAFIPASGWMTDRYGSRTVFGSAIAVFTLGSVLCGLAPGLPAFTAARILQAIGGAMMVPVGRLVVLRSVEKHELIRAMAFVSIPGLVAPVIGPPLGGFITTYASWRWIFFLNIPIGLIGVALVAIFFANVREDERRPFDVAGFVLSGAGLAALMFGLSSLGRESASAGLAVGILAIGAVLAVLAYRHIRRSPHPLVNLETLRIRNFAIATLWGGTLFRMTIGSTPFLWPLMFQTTFGMSAFVSGLYMMACTGGDLGAQAFCRKVVRHFGFRNTLVFNGFACTALFAACVTFAPGSPPAFIIAVLLAIGVSRSLQFTSLNALGYVDVPPPLMSSATSLAGTLQQLSIGMGVAFGALILHVAAQARGEAAQSYSLGDFHVAFVAMTVIALGSTFHFLRLGASAGEAARGRPPSDQGDTQLTRVEKVGTST
jgi:EmrB/QacA subfamily drug resistance transporter